MNYKDTIILNILLKQRVPIPLRDPLKQYVDKDINPFGGGRFT